MISSLLISIVLKIFSISKYVIDVWDIITNDIYYDIWIFYRFVKILWQHYNYNILQHHTYLITSSARSATLEDTSWAWLYLASWNLPDSQFCLKSKTEPKCSRHRTKLERDTAQKKCIPGGGDTAHTFWTGGQ